MRHIFCVVLFLCLLGHAVLGQSTQPAGQGAGTSQAAGEGTPTTETNAGLIVPFLEGTSVFFTLNGGTRFEADIVPHLFVYQNFSDIVDVNKQGEQRFAIVITGTTGVRIRMFNTDSAPVRTPSYMPRGNVQFLWARNLRCAFVRTTCADGEAEARSPRIALWEAHLTVGHHSNGQDGCLFIQNPPRVEGEECAPKPVDPKAANINRKDGSFSTNYLRAGVNHSWNRLRRIESSKPADPEAIYGSYFEWTLRGDVEDHPLKLRGLHIHRDIAEDYGRTRLLGGTTWAWKALRFCSRRLEVGGTVTRIIGADESVNDWIATGSATCFPFSNGGWGFFVRAYRGQDYYNLGYLDNIARVQLGATFNQSDFFRFRRRPAK